MKRIFGQIKAVFTGLGVEFIRMITGGLEELKKFSLRGYGINIVSRGRYPKRARYLMRKYGNPENIRMFWMREKKMQQPLPIKKFRDYILIKRV